MPSEKLRKFKEESKMKPEAIRKLDEVGRIVLPKEMRNALGWHNESNILITMQNNCLTLKAHPDSCIVCGNTVNIVPIHDKFICQACIDGLSEI